MGLLDSFNPDDPATMGLLSAAGSMFQASGPSLMPRSFGQVLGAGLQGGLAGYKGARDAARENTALQLQNAQLAQALRQGEITQAVYQKLLTQINGGDVPGTSQGGGGVSTGAPGVSAAPIAPAAQPGAGGVGSSFGLSNNSMLGGMLAGPGELGKAIVSANAPTDFTKLLMQSGIDPNSALGRQFMQQQVAKQNNIPLVAGRAGAPMYDATGRVVSMAPKIPDNAIPQIVDGQVVGVSPLPGAAGVEQANSYAGAAGKAQATPVNGVDANGNPVFTNALTASGGGLRISPDVQAQRDAASLSILQQERKNPKNSADDNAALDREIANRQRGLAAAQTIRPAAAPGFNVSQEKLAGAGADRYIGLLTQASDSPTRVNVYDNILKLSKEGVQTGPSADWSNKLKGYTASIPGVDSMFPGMKKDVSNFQEISKFMYQNAQRNWSAAGGTGTDAQLEAFSKSSPNSALFPQALQAIAEWGKAGELALQGKANAAQAWKDRNGGNVANQDQFERTWRNNFAPELYQLQTMEPAQAAQFVANMKKTNPNGYATLMMKAKALKNIGGL